MKTYKYLSILVLSTILVSCETLFFEEEPKNNPEDLFENFWETYNNCYAGFEARKVDWGEMYATYRPQVNANTTDDELYTILTKMLTPLNDMHIKLTAPDRKVFTSNIYFNSKIDYDIFDIELIKNEYLTKINLDYEGVVMGWNGNVGYVWFEYISDNMWHINDVLNYFENADGLIIDLRHNGGGAFTYSYTSMGRLTNEKRLTHRSKTKNGTGKNDFTEWYEWNISPEGDYYDKPLVLLTDRYTGSAAERTVMALKVLPNLIQIGDTTNGGHSTMIGRELANGWSYTVCPQVIEWADGKCYEGIGMPPDIYIKNTMEEINAGQDKTLELAIGQF